MAKFFVDLDSQSFQVINDIQEYWVDELKEIGMNVFASFTLPDNSYKEDERLIYKLQLKKNLFHLLELVEYRIEELLAQNNKGIVLYQKFDYYDLDGTNELDKMTLQKIAISDNRLIIHIFPLPDNNIVEVIKEHIKSLL